MKYKNIVFITLLTILPIQQIFAIEPSQTLLYQRGMDQAKIFVKYKEGNAQEKEQAQIEMVGLLNNMVDTFNDAYLNERAKNTDPNLGNYDASTETLTNDFQFYNMLLDRQAELNQNPTKIGLQDLEKFAFALTFLSLERPSDVKTIFINYTSGAFQDYAIHNLNVRNNPTHFFKDDIIEFFKNYQPQNTDFGQVELYAYEKMKSANVQNNTNLEIAPFFSKDGAIGIETMSYAIAHELMPVGFFLNPSKFPHIGMYAQVPIGFIKHDYNHIDSLAASMSGNIVYQNNNFKNVYERIAKEDEVTKLKDLIMLFLLSHELTFNRTQPENAYGFKSFVDKSNIFTDRPKRYEGILDIIPERYHGQYILDLKDIHFLLNKIQGVQLPKIPVTLQDTWQDFLNFEQSIKNTLADLFKDFKTRHPEYSKKTWGYLKSQPDDATKQEIINKLEKGNFFIEDEINHLMDYTSINKKQENLIDFLFNTYIPYRGNILSTILSTQSAHIIGNIFHLFININQTPNLINFLIGANEIDPTIKKPIFGLIDNQNMNNDYGLSVLEYILRQFHDAQTDIFFNLLPNMLFNSINVLNYRLALWILINAPKEVAKTLITERKVQQSYKAAKNLLNYTDSEKELQELKNLIQKIDEILAQP
jgi:hypothetical protein